MLRKRISVAALALFGASFAIADTPYAVIERSDTLAFDQLSSAAAASGKFVQCYPWSDAKSGAYSDTSWEIDSYLWDHPEVVAIFAAGSRAKNVIAAAEPEETALAAYSVYTNLARLGYSRPSSSLVRAALAADSTAGETLYRDSLAYEEGTNITFAVKSRGGELRVSLAWIDAGNWNFLFDPAGSMLSNDLDLSITARANGESVVYSANDHVSTLETITLETEEGQVYVITIRGTAVGERAANAALAIAGDVEAVEVPVYTYSAPWYRYDFTEGGIAYARYSLLNETNEVEVVVGEEVPKWEYEEWPSEYLVRHIVFICDDTTTNRYTIGSKWVAAYDYVDPVEIPATVPVQGVFAGVCLCYTDDEPYPAYDFGEDDLCVDDGYDIVYCFYPEDYCESCVKIPEWYFLRTLWPVYMYDDRVLEPEEYDEDDPDGDGFTNYEEYYLDTDPFDAADAFRFTSFTPTGFSFRGGKGRGVIVERADSPDGTEWSAVFESEIVPAEGTTSVELPSGMTSGFFRLRVGKKDD